VPLLTIRCLAALPPRDRPMAIALLEIGELYLMPDVAVVDTTLTLANPSYSRSPPRAWRPKNSSIG